MHEDESAIVYFYDTTIQISHVYFIYNTTIIFVMFYVDKRKNPKDQDRLGLSFLHKVC